MKKVRKKKEKKVINKLILKTRRKMNIEYNYNKLTF
jgi:hypothetical protein